MTKKTLQFIQKTALVILTKHAIIYPLIIVYILLKFYTCKQNIATYRTIYMPVTLLLTHKIVEHQTKCYCNH